MYQKLQRFLPGVDFLKFRIDAFKKSENHWIDITLAQWQRQAQAKNVKIVVGKIETPIQVELANQLAIPLRQGYAYGQPVTLKPEK